MPTPPCPPWHHRAPTSPSRMMPAQTRDPLSAYTASTAAHLSATKSCSATARHALGIQHGTREHTTVAPGRRISRRCQTLKTWLGERRTCTVTAPPPSPFPSCLMGSPARPRSTSIALCRRCARSLSTNGSVPPAFATWRWASGAEDQATVTATNRGWGRAFKWLRHRCLPRARRTSSRPIAAAAA